MSDRFRKAAFVLAVILAVTGPVVAQGTQFGTVRGIVTLSDGTPAPGVAVTATSPAQPGQRVVATSESGEYILRNLVPGVYTITYQLEGLTTVQSTATVSLGQISPVDVTMEVAAIEETITVTGDAASVLASSEVSTTYTAEQVNQLPIARTPAAIAALAPGLTTNTPNAGQVTISGGFAYDNVFLIDGVDANDNLFGTSNPVFIEEAIADQQVLTSGISAEYGRFSGGVINIITKAGGNEFSGSFRTDLTNEDWRDKTPLEDERGTELIDNVNEAYSATLGGYVLRDTLWFFAAGRDEESSAQGTFPVTGLPLPTSLEEDRQEGKLTWNVNNSHQIQGQFTQRDQTGVNRGLGVSATPDTLRTRNDPSDLLVARYHGVWTSSLFGELQYSEKTFGFRNTHGDEGLVQSSPFFAFFGLTPGGDLVSSPVVHHNAPFFDGTDPEDRDNEQAYGALSWFADTAAAGSHDIKFGVEDFTSMRVGGNSQSPTNIVFDTGALVDGGGNYVLDENNKLVPVWVAGITYIENWLPVRGSTVDIETRSAFVNDRWRLNDQWSFNVGVRYEQVKGDATGGITTVDESRLVPRLGASLDVLGDGRYRVDATYSQYSGKYSEAQFAENTTVGKPRGVFSEYVGPDGVGFDFAPAFDLSNYVPFAAEDGTANVFVADDIRSPVVTEYTLAGGMQLARGGYLKAIYTNREYDDFVEDFVCTAAAGVACPGPGDTGITNVVVEGIVVGPTNNSVIDNSDFSKREYEAIQLIGRHVLTDRWDLNGSWTYQLTNDGNFEGEGVNTPGSSSFFGDFPGYFTPGRHFPDGQLNDFQEHKIRLWSTYHVDLRRAGDLALTLLGNYDSGGTFSFVGTLPRVFTPGQQQILSFYDSLPGSTQTIFFGERGAGEFRDSYRFDFAFVYDLPLVQTWGLNLFLKGDVINILGEDKQIKWNEAAGTGTISVTPDVNGPLDSNGLPTEFITPASFGNATANAHFVTPREYRFAVGIRF